MKRSATSLLYISFLLFLGGCNTTGMKPPSGVSDKTRSDIAVTNTKLGVEYMREGNDEIAFQKLTKALYADPEFAPALSAMALLHDRMGETAKAQEYFQRAMDLNPQDPTTLNNYAGFLCRHKKTEQAEGMFMQAAKDPHYKTPEIALTNAGLCHLRANHFIKAEGYLRKALDINPKIPPALLAMARISFNTKKTLSARAYLQRYAVTAKHNPVSLWLALRVERALGDVAVSNSYGRVLRKRFPDSPQARKSLELSNQ